MTIKTNIPETKIPGSYTEYNYYAGPNGLPANVQKILLIGDVSEEGALEANKPTAVYTEVEALNLAGAGSVLHQMYQAAKNAWKYAQITLLRHSAVAGSKALWKIAVENPEDKAGATAAGSVSVFYNKSRVSVGVAVGDSAETVAANLVLAVNADTSAPFIASADEGEVTLTAKSNGAYISAAKGGVKVSVSTKGTDISVGEPDLTAGVGVVDIKSALKAAFPERYHLIALPVCDANNLTLLKDHLMDAAAPLEQRGQRGIAAVVVDGVNDATSIAKAKNCERLHIAAVKNSIPSAAWEISAALAAVFASNSQPNVPMNDAPISGLGIPDTNDKWSGEEQDGLLNGGVIPLIEEESTLCIVRAVTTCSMKNGVRFEKLVDTGVIATLDYFRDSILAMHKIKYKNQVIHELLPDALNEDNIATARQLEKAQLLRFIDRYESAFRVEESTDIPGRLICQIPAPVVPGLNQIYSTIDLYLN